MRGAATQTPAVTMTGRRTDVTTTSAVSHVDRPVSSLVRPLDIGRRRKPALFVRSHVELPSVSTPCTWSTDFTLITLGYFCHIYGTNR